VKTEKEEIEEVFSKMDAIVTFCAWSEHKQLHLLGMVVAYALRRIKKSWSKV
jgi:hypothetical protein